jgi:hypothetical protein
MTIPIAGLVLSVIIYTALVVVIDRIVIAKAKGSDIPINKCPESVPTLSEPEKAIIPLYQAEWKVIIETQMHFNDLIIRFRSIVLTAFITLVGASVALQKTERIDERQLHTLFCILFVLWGTAFVVDFFYYHQLLLGSVAQAMKFDQSELGKRLGLFGLTTCISAIVHPPASKIIVGLFYGIPTIALVVLLMHSYP